MRSYGNSAYVILFVSTVLAGVLASRLFAAPAGPTQHHGSMGETAVIGSTSTLLFGGAIPPNAFMVQINNAQGGQGFCVVNDNGPAGGDISAGTVAGFAVTIIGSTIGGPIAPPLFVTPPGYKPIGPISVWCNGTVRRIVQTACTSFESPFRRCGGR
jgi:hypothetical protein